MARCTLLNMPLGAHIFFAKSDSSDGYIKPLISMAWIAQVPWFVIITDSHFVCVEKLIPFCLQ